VLDAVTRQGIPGGARNSYGGRCIMMAIGIFGLLAVGILVVAAVVIVIVLSLGRK
jgi:hypothetical protein